MISKKTKTSVLFTIFGAKGDLTRRKLIPALYNLYIEGHLPEFCICCIDYLESDLAAFKADLRSAINEFSRNGTAQENEWKKFAACIFYLQRDFNSADTYTSIRKFA